jgi:hypothetical protein
MESLWKTLVTIGALERADTSLPAAVAPTQSRSGSGSRFVRLDIALGSDSLKLRPERVWRRRTSVFSNEEWDLAGASKPGRALRRLSGSSLLRFSSMPLALIDLGISNI